MIFDTQLLFYHTGTAFAFTAGEFVSLVGVTSTGLASSVINLTVLEDLGIGDGEAIPKVACYIGTAVTSASTGLLINMQFQGSTDSSNWTTYVESGTASTASYLAGTKVFPISLPHRSPGASLPQYYRLNIAATGVTSQTISAGTILAGVVIQRDDSPIGLYGSGFVVAA